jgi:hypothetical protein
VFRGDAVAGVVHRRRTWSQACEAASARLWPGVEFPRRFFYPYTSKRVNGKPTRMQRERTLLDTELHHWPDSVPEALQRLGLPALAAQVQPRPGS